MPFDESLFLAGVIGAFVLFAVGLAWVSVEEARNRKKRR